MAKRDTAEAKMTTGMEPLIRKTPGVCGGDACLGATRIPVWMLVLHRRWGHDDQAILADYPRLTKAELAAAWQYAAQHGAEMDAAIEDNQGA